ncbi:MAG: hypothetical protein A3I24_03680 [Candidatus Harrisonbacteria bacterium RIFCSPLOWO2_02_FULL_41_13b]|uniref:Uncharacterized protein n=1 Tax=Candidatus Harrisonbacteria bacterium RIFCSPLOWO2_02_FULL_41_13b TaxID=1798409 RepID=A0A1G1ZTN9_9BACT|nr:MAG: hypothetical protein A3I24_03680 [Candidatus Harrisonbacteria bacterium RIFCSPLOWO2_02_FULL_41_13b]
MKIFIFPMILLTVLALLITAQTVFAEGYNLKIQLPTEQGPVTTITGPADYIRNFYNFGLLAVGLLAMLMIVIGAIQYSTSGGDTSKISDAKDRIYKAILGIALLLGAYVLLRTINPELVLLKDPKLTSVTIPLEAERAQALFNESKARLKDFEAAKRNEEKIIQEKGADSIEARQAIIQRIEADNAEAKARIIQYQYNQSLEIRELNNLAQKADKSVGDFSSNTERGRALAQDIRVYRKDINDLNQVLLKNAEDLQKLRQTQ